MVAYISGLSRRWVFSVWQRTWTVRVTGSSVSPMYEMRPGKISPL